MNGPEATRAIRIWSGVVAGALTVLVFTLIHDWLISDIWFSFPAMLVVGCACGGSMAWTYRTLIRRSSLRTWSGFVGLELGFLLLLGGVSMLAFEPVVPMAVLIAANEPPSELIGQAMPLTVTFVLGTTGIRNLIWGRAPHQIVSSLVTSTLLIVVLGLNVSVLGLVEFSEDSLRPLGEFFGLMAFIMVAYWAFVLVLEPRVMSRKTS